MKAEITAESNAHGITIQYGTTIITVFDAATCTKEEAMVKKIMRLLNPEKDRQGFSSGTPKRRLHD